MESSTTLKLKEIADAYEGGTGNRVRKRGRRRSDALLPLVFNGKQLHSYAKDNAFTDEAEGAGSGSSTAKGMPVITIRSLTDISIDDSQVAHYAMKREVPPDGLTQEGDVVVSLTAPFSAACVNADHVGYFVTNACAIIRFAKPQVDQLPERMRIDPWFLACYLNLDSVRSVLKSKTLGGKSPSLKIDQLEDIDIPQVGADQQRLLADMARSYADCARMRRSVDALQREALESAFARSFGAGTEA